MKETKERWRSLPITEGYDVSNLGRIRTWRSRYGISTTKSKLIKPEVTISNQNRYTITLADGSRKRFYGARLVALTWIDQAKVESGDYWVKHVDDTQNDAVDNLELLRKYQRRQYHYPNGHKPRGDYNNIEDYTADIEQLHKQGLSRKEIAKKLNLMNYAVTDYMRKNQMFYHSKYTVNEYQELKGMAASMYKAGYKVSQIAKELDTSIYFVHQFLGTDKAYKRKRKLPDKKI